MPALKFTSAELYDALRVQYPRAAVLREVTMEDEDEALRARAATVAKYPRYKKIYEKKGLLYEAEFPEGYDYKKAVLFRRIDALIFDGQQRTAVEIKISKADFQRDTDEKRNIWRRHTHRFVYLTPKGLLTPEMIPDGCGLWEFDGESIAVVKKARINKEIKDFPASMVKYFAWRAFAAEQNKTTRRRKRRKR